MLKTIDDIPLWEWIGGEETIEKLVDIFYSKIEQDKILRPLFPQSLEQGKHWQKLFLIQRFGGPRLYEKERGAPMLRKRHQPFPIGPIERNQWVKLMKESLDEVGIDSNHQARPYLDVYFELVATKMINKI